MREFHLIDLIPIGFGLLLFLALLTAPGWWPDVLAFLRWCGAVVRQAVAAGAILKINVPSVSRFQEDDDLGEEEITSTTGSMPLRTGTEPAGSPLVRPDTDAERTSSNEENDLSPSISHKMTTPDLVVLLAVQKDEHGEYRWSANKIVEFVGGTRADVMARIAAVRPRSAPAQPVTPGHMERPQGGW